MTPMTCVSLNTLLNGNQAQPLMTKVFLMSKKCTNIMYQTVVSYIRMQQSYVPHACFKNISLQFELVVMRQHVDVTSCPLA